MTLRNLGPWLLTRPTFTQRLDAVVADALCEELGNCFVRHHQWSNIEHDWQYLLLSASVLAASNEGACQAAALRIAQACLTIPDTSDHRRDSAALVLDTLANHPAIALAVSRALLRPGLEKRLPAPARIEWTQRALDHSIVLSNDSVLRVNHFQRRFWQNVVAHEWVSVSAPTSAGKSFIMTRWIGEQLRGNPRAIVVYLVPTRALIHQVETDLAAFLVEEGITDIPVSSLPLARTLVPGRGTVLVFTQERLHILLAAVPQLRVDVLVVDEAHKVGDRQRGVLLQHVIERVVQINPSARLVFASPMTSNPEILLEDAVQGTNTAALTSEDVTISQNLLWVSQVAGQPRQWEVTACIPDKQVPLGRLTLPANPSSESKRLSFVAFAMGGLRAGNIVYVNGAADAEKIAAQLYDLSGPEGEVRNSDVDDLIELARRVVHPEFRLATFLRRGIAFHYGNLPLLIRTEIERLFSANIVRYLVCTSTLIEGVNMSCRSIFLRGPQKGRGRPMSADDFWNLAGRAGRWGREFQGNVVCVDATRPGLWGPDGAPQRRARYAIRRTADVVLGDGSALLQFIEAGAAPEIAARRSELEYVFAYLVALHGRYGSVRSAPWARRYDEALLGPIAEAVAARAATLETPMEVVERNPGVNPVTMDAVLRYFRERQGAIEELLPVDPADEGAVAAYTRIFVRLARLMTPRLGPTPGRSAMLALTVVQWMRGFPLARLIAGRIDYCERNKRPYKTPEVIRSVMEEVEQIARFEAPRALAVYRDLLQLHLTALGRQDLVERMPDLSVLLELGVSHLTQVSLIGIGLSRTSAITLSDLIAADQLTETQVLAWVEENRAVWSEADLPALVKREIQHVLTARRAVA
ncbi:DEAD/DEAH box helicase [Geomonas sp.]|uniref:DEAD/DEAH box helicase n=1 Tax=Geomonas sp. TaxID=2651584 RepID=UPI002B46310E|nr:DEAD/DEAH box helicase [Geomonas sp.]HJV36707.1 DEAD/DEAH box helicase [Geomonas sp.]